MCPGAGKGVSWGADHLHQAARCTPHLPGKTSIAEATCAAVLGKVSAGVLTACIKQQQARRKLHPNLFAQSQCALQRRQEKQTACMKPGANAVHSSRNHAVLQGNLCSMHQCLERRRLAMRPPTSSMIHAHKLGLLNVSVNRIAQPP